MATQFNKNSNKCLNKINNSIMYWCRRKIEVRQIFFVTPFLIMKLLIINLSNTKEKITILKHFHPLLDKNSKIFYHYINIVNIYKFM